MTNDIILMATPDDLASSWAVYMLYDVNTAEMQYIGHCKLTQVFSLPDARGAGKLDLDEPIMLRVAAICPDKATAAATVLKTMNANGTPPMNQANVSARNMGVKCIDTGETWSTITEASEAHGLSQPALSNHLNGKPGYKSVKGKTYKRIENNE